MGRNINHRYRCHGRTVYPWSGLSHAQRVACLLVGSFALSLSAWLIWGYFGVEHQLAKIVSVRWEWHIDVEKWEAKHYERVVFGHPSCPDKSFCGDVYNYRTWTETRVWTSSDSKGRVTVHTDTDRYYTYDHDEWVPHRTFSRTGTDHSPKPPEDFVLERVKTSARVQHQCQVGEIRRPYFVILDCDDGQARVWSTTDIEEWSKWNKDQTCDVNLTGFGEVRELSPLVAESH